METLVYYKKKDGSVWHGPATVLGQDGQLVLVKHGGVYVRVHPCILNPIKIDNQPSTQIDHSNISLQDKSNEATTQPMEHDEVAEAT